MDLGVSVLQTCENMINKYTHKVLVGKDCLIEDTFIPQMNILCNLAENLSLKLYINSSYRLDANVSGAIVEPAQMSNHMVGHAIDCNLVDDKGVFWNSQKLTGGLTGNVALFIEKVRENPPLRWGGWFHTKDSVHFDDSLNVSNPELWHELYNQINKK